MSIKAKSNYLKFLGFDPKTHSVSTEIIAGITTFLTMAYILAVNPSIFADLKGNKMDTAAVFTATGLAAVVGTLIMAIYAKKPFALAPGMGLNAFFVYTVCNGMGYSWQFALTAILLEGFLFVFFTVTNIRSLIVNAIPASLKYAIGVGIGLYIAFIGLRNGGVIVSSEATAVTLGNITEGVGLLTIIGMVVTAFLIIKNVGGSMLLGILITTAIGIPMGITHLDGFISAPPSIESIAMKFEWAQILSIDMLIVVCTFLFIDMFDTIGTIIGVSTKTGMLRPDGTVPGLRKAFMADAVATICGACFGTNTTTTYVESAAGISQGGRTGLTSFTVAVCFALALFFSPIFLAIPPSATAPVLFIVGLFMISPITQIPLNDYSESIPAFVTIIMMPLSYSIADGILLGFITYVVLNLFDRKEHNITWPMVLLALLFAAKFIFI